MVLGSGVRSVMLEPRLCIAANRAPELAGGEAAVRHLAVTPAADTAVVKATTDRTNGRIPEPVPGADTPRVGPASWAPSLRFKGHRRWPLAFVEGGRRDAVCCRGFDAPLARVSE
jgi:hypothetical protein